MSIQLLDGCLQIFNVDHGQCALLMLPGLGRSYVVLIDCGHSTNYKGGPWYPGRHLAAMGVSYVDLLICTNYDEDHASGYPDLSARNITVGCILGNPTVAAETIVKLKTQDGMGPGIGAIATALAGRRQIGWPQVPPLIPGLNLTWAWNPYPLFEDENNLSLIAILNIRGFNFMFPGDMETNGFNHLITTCAEFRQLLPSISVLVASHHGRESGICTSMFDNWGCNPSLVVISDDYKQFDTQETTNYYGRKARGIRWFRNQGARYVLTTRSDDEIRFSFSNGQCLAW